MKKVMVFGTFDILHPGHLYLFGEAKKLGDHLIAVVARDSTVEKMKHRKPHNSENARLEKVRECKDVDEALLGDSDDYYRVIESYEPDVICLGYDQHSAIEKSLQDELLKRGITAKIFRIGPYKEHIYKSSKLRGGGGKNRKISAVIYDFDGTIADTLPSHLAAYRHALENLGIGGLSDSDIVEKCFNKLDKDVAEYFGIDRKEFTRIYKERGMEERRRASLQEGLIDTLKRIKEMGMKIAVGSMDWRESVKELVDVLGIREYFDCVEGNMMPERTKGETFSAICSEMGVKPEEVIVVGDADSDIRGAKEIGARTVLYYPKGNERFYSLDMLTKHNPDFIIKRHDEIFGVIEKIEKAT